MTDRYIKAKPRSSAGGIGSAGGNVYQKEVATWWLTRVLTQSSALCASFGLETGTWPLRVEGQTDDHVDDLQTEFNDGTKVFLQCKKSIHVTDIPTSEFGKTWAQFGRQIKDQQKSPATIRCVLCFEKPNGSLAKLQELFRKFGECSNCELLAHLAKTELEKRVARTISQLHSRLKRRNPAFPKLSEIVRAVYFQRLELGQTFDSQIQSVEAMQNGVLAEVDQTPRAWDVLRSMGEELTTCRGLKFDISIIRNRLVKAGVHLKDVPRYAQDLLELDAESRRTLDTFRAYHRNQVGKKFTLNRPIADEIVARSSVGSLLVIGEPGTGKTGVLMATADKLAALGKRVWFLSVERYRAESLPQLENELKLHHRLTDICAAAGGDKHAVFLLDGFDTARERGKQATWREFVREAIRHRVPVIATIRLFDLRFSLPWQELFPLNTGEVASAYTPGLEKVRYANVGELSDTEIERTLTLFSGVREMLAVNPALRPLAKNLFNFNLLCGLSAGGIAQNPIRSQLELLDAWWNARLSEAIDPRIESTLTRLVERMVADRSLQANAAGLEPDAINDAQSIGLIRHIPQKPGFMPDDSVEFTHNVLYDFAAFRLFLLPRRSLLVAEIAAPDSWGLFLRPSLAHYFTWFWEKYRNEFWERAIEFHSSSASLIHKTVVWFTIARSAGKREDFLPILKGLITQGDSRQTWLELARGVIGSGEAVVWKQLFSRGDGLWWVEYACDLLRSGELIISDLGWRILLPLYYQIQNFKPDSYSLINEAARLEVETHWPVAVPLGPGTKPCIWLFCHTISGNPDQSTELIRRMITPGELALSGYYRGSEVATEIVAIARCVPKLTVEIYQRLYAHRELNSDQIPMGSSAVLPMQMSRHDFYSKCHHHLKESLLAIFEFDPKTATRAVCAVVGKESDSAASGVSRVFNFSGVDIEVRSDFNHRFGFDQPFDEQSRLVAAWCECLQELSSLPHGKKQWQEVITALTEEARPAEIWAALLSVVPSNGEFFRDAIWPVLHSPDVLTCWKIKRYVAPCIRALANVTDPLKLAAWQDAVLALRSEDLDRHNSSSGRDAMELLKSSYLLCLPERVLTKRSNNFLAGCKPGNVSSLAIKDAKEVSLEERRALAQRENGLNPDNPAHVQLEKDLASVDPGRNPVVDTKIFTRIAAIEARFAALEVEVQNHFRGRFQNAFSWVLRELAQNAKRLSHKHIEELCRICSVLIQTGPGHHNALEAISLAVSRKRTISDSDKMFLNQLVGQSDPDIVGRFGIHMWPLLKTWPEFVWNTLSLWGNRMGEKSVAKGLRYVLRDNWFWWLFHMDKQRALHLLESMLNSARQVQDVELADKFLAWFTAVLVNEENASCRTIVEAALSNPQAHGSELSSTIRILSDCNVPRGTNTTVSSESLRRVLELVELFFNSALGALSSWQDAEQALPAKLRKTEAETWVKAVAQQFDSFAGNLRYGADGVVRDRLNSTAECFAQTANEWWTRAEPVFGHLEKWLHPHLGDHLINALAVWFPLNPKKCMHWLRRLCEAGKQTNLLIEHLTVAVVIKMLKTCLVDHRDLLNTDKVFLQDFAEALEALLSTANPDALAMTASLDEFDR